MRSGWYIGRIFGIPLKIHPSWLIIFALVSFSLAVGFFPTQFPDLPAWSYWVKAVIAALMLFASILLHELGHSLLARRMGVEIADITLFVFGGVSHMRGEPREAKAELLVALVGPAISLGLWLVFGVLAYALGAARGGVTPGVALLGYLSAINLLLAVFNMLPAFPLDGGRALRAVLWLVRKDLASATRTAVTVGKVISYLIIAGGFLQLLAGGFGGLWLILIGWLILQAGSATGAQVSLREALGSLRTGEVMVRDVVTVDADLTVEQLVRDYFTRHLYGGYPVRSGDRVLGLVTLRDLQKAPPELRDQVRVAAITDPLRPDLVISPDLPVSEALDLMMQREAGRLLVMDHDRLVGLITLNGILHLAQVRSSLGGKGAPLQPVHAPGPA
jgi:Zn-dependent protease/CBS domain-containing protein